MVQQQNIDLFFAPISTPTDPAVPVVVDAAPPVEQDDRGHGGGQEVESVGGESSETGRADTLGKRDLGNLSFESADDNMGKHARIDLGSPDIISTFKHLLNSMTADISSEIASNMLVINARLDRIHVDINTRLASVETRMSALEQADASRQLAVVELSVNV